MCKSTWQVYTWYILYYNTFKRLFDGLKLPKIYVISGIRVRKEFHARVWKEFHIKWSPWSRTVGVMGHVR